jgi:hypothetical protein
LCCCSRRICFCSLGFPRGLESAKAKNEFLEGVSRIEEFLRDPWGIRVREKGEEEGGGGGGGWNDTVQVVVPKVIPPPPPPLPPPVVDGGIGIGGGGNVVDEVAAAASAQSKRVALQKKAAAAMVAAEDYARRFESGDLVPVRFLHLNWLSFSEFWRILFG